MTRRLFSLAVLAALAVAAVRAQAPSTPALMPMPAHVDYGQGQLLLDAHFKVAFTGYTEPRLTAARERFLSTLTRQTGLVFDPAASDPVLLTIKTAGPSAPVQKLGEDESYHLTVTATSAELSAANPLGILHGLQTFLQLVHITPQGFAAPAITISDAPRFPWRGLMIDAGRHFQPIPVIERNLDGMEAVKLNVFHWHLSENQGFPIESKVFPLLQEKGAFEGHYYTQDQVRHILAYARERGIRVVPEFDMPCHTTSWFVGYPQLASGPGPYKLEDHWGIFAPAMDPSRESTFVFLNRFIGEMTALFPDAYFHIGGDECNGKEWDANPRIQAFMREHHFKNNAELQAYFTGRVQKIVAAHHKIAMGWDEVLQPNTPRDVVIQSWRRPKGLAAAARQGNRVVLSNGYYIDLNQPAAEHYLVDPLGGDAATLTPAQQALVLGGEATMWSEFTTPEIIDSRIWPRTAAIAERLWSPASVRDVPSMYARLAAVSEKLEDLGLTHRSFTRVLIDRMAGASDPAALEVLASAVQPPLGYQREELAQYTILSPLNHLVDAVPPESETARRFAVLAGRIAAGKATPEEIAAARAQLALWRDNDHTLRPTLASSSITAELAPLSHNLSIVSVIGIEAIDNIEHHHVPTANELGASRTFLKEAAQPQAVLRDMAVAPVQQLLEASAAQH
ncbi:MAG TPA: family 20 glycosylhydrolase [Terracidiphilus sp.]|nr:family 20 glycosylhydrolase [Terracidiphilus sp.]